jgi:hypothetical protein
LVIRQMTSPAGWSQSENRVALTIVPVKLVGPPVTWTTPPLTFQ